MKMHSIYTGNREKEVGTVLWFSGADEAGFRDRAARQLMKNTGGWGVGVGVGWPQRLCKRPSHRSHMVWSPSHGPIQLRLLALLAWLYSIAGRQLQRNGQGGGIVIWRSIASPIVRFLELSWPVIKKRPQDMAVRLNTSRNFPAGIKEASVFRLDSEEELYFFLRFKASHY